MEDRISRQISVYKTDKKLIELTDKLNSAPIKYYAHIHAQGDEDGDGRKVYSKIGVLIQDYSAGTGSATKRATANLSPEEVGFVCKRLYAGVQEFDYRSEKIFGKPDENGYAIVTKMIIKRSATRSDGSVSKLPWYIEIENGKGKPQKTSKGGTYCTSGSYVSEVKLFVNLTDMDAYKLFSAADKYISCFEMAYTPALIRKAKTMLEEIAAESSGRSDDSDGVF